MKKIFLGMMTLCCSLASAPALATVHQNKHPIQVHASTAYPNCTFFQLDGTAVADSTVSNAPWFALPKNHYSYNELFAILLTAKATGRPIEVHTQGGGLSDCTYASVTVILLL